MRRLISKAQSLTNRFVSWAITLWRTSIQARILTSVVVLSAIVIATLGFGLATLVAQRLLDSKVAVANEEIDRARATVEMSIENSPEMDLQALLNVTRSDLVDRFSGADASSLTISEPLLVAPAPDSAELVSSPVNVEIPEQLRAVVHQGQVAYQTMTMTGENGNEFSALVIGTPTATSVEGLELHPHHADGSRGVHPRFGPWSVGRCNCGDFGAARRYHLVLLQSGDCAGALSGTDCATMGEWLFA